MQPSMSAPFMLTFLMQPKLGHWPFLSQSLNSFKPVAQWVGWRPHWTCVKQLGYLTGTGTVLDFGTPWHTVYPCCGVAGICGYISKVIRILIIFSGFFIIIFPLSWSCHTVMQPNVALWATCTSLSLYFHHHYIHPVHTSK
jgi:hypothetical protein